MVGLTLIGLGLRSRRFAVSFGSGAQGAYAWALSLVHKRPTDAVADAVLRFRTDTLQLLGTRWRPLSAVVVTRYLTRFLLFVVSVRAVGVDRDAASLVELFAVYALVSMLSIIQLTPGGVGVTEALYLSGLTLAAEGVEESLIVAGVPVFRPATAGASATSYDGRCRLRSPSR